MIQTASGQSLAALLASLEQRGDTCAIIAFAKDDAVQWSARTLAEAAGRLAGGLASEGAGKGETVGLFAGNRPEWVAACLGTFASGAAVMPLDVQLEDEPLRHAIEDGAPKLIFADAEREARLSALGLNARVVLLDRRDGPESWRGVQGEAALPHLEPRDHAALFYTSGTTGPPKGVPLTHANLLSQLTALRGAEIVASGDRVLLPLPLHHVYPFVVGMLVPLELGVPIVLPRSLTGPEIVRAARDGEASVMIGVPRLYSALLDNVETRARASGRLGYAAYRSVLGATDALERLGINAGRRPFAAVHRRIGGKLRLLASGGAPLEGATERRLRALGWRVAVGYGLTETAPLVTIRLPPDGPERGVGRPVPGVELRIDPRATEADAGEPLVRGPNVFGAYRGLEEKTRGAFTRDGWYRTGDLGRLDGRGHLHLVGRTSEMIVTEGGKNVQPEDVEAAYVGHDALREVGVLQRGDRLVAIVVPEPKAFGHDENVEEGVARAVAESSKRLPSYQRVSELAVSREALPRTHLGKLRRHRLPERFERAREGEPRAAGPMARAQMSAQDRALLDQPAAQAVWNYLAERYAQIPLTPDSDVGLDLGIDSLEWVSLSLEISQRAGVSLSEEAIADVDTVRDLLEAAAGAEEGEAPDLSARPEEALDEEQRRWLDPLPRTARMLADAMYALNAGVMRTLFRFEVHGSGSRIDNAPAATIFAPNHASLLDPFVVAAALPAARRREIYWGGWTGIAFRNAFVRFGSRLAQAVPVDPAKGPVSSLAFAAAVLKRGKSIVWFPEGERSKDGEVKALKPGIAVVLESQDVHVVPVRVEGTHDALPVGRRLPRLRRRIVVRFGEPLKRADLVRDGAGEDDRERLLAGLARRIRRVGED